ncbi:MAG: guanylate kinase [Candidatus Krumholzibacteria bacterium]|nr:guanylate kinase [Candidatus Krumholzibacteria bacterium]
MVMDPASSLALVVSGPSGSGKTTLVKHLMLRFSRSHFSISATTRPLRGEEVDGVDYRFLDQESFRELREGEGLLEWAEVHGEYYGSLRSEVVPFLDEGRTVFLDIDVQGGLQVKEALGPRAWLLYVLPPDRETLEDRLRGRGTEADEKVALRLENALGELAEIPRYDSVVINEDFSTAVDEAERLIRSREANSAAWLEGGGRELLRERFSLSLP